MRVMMVASYTDKRSSRRVSQDILLCVFFREHRQKGIGLFDVDVDVLNLHRRYVMDMALLLWLG